MLFPNHHPSVCGILIRAQNLQMPIARRKELQSDQSHVFYEKCLPEGRSQTRCVSHTAITIYNDLSGEITAFACKSPLAWVTKRAPACMEA